MTDIMDELELAHKVNKLNMETINALTEGETKVTDDAYFLYQDAIDTFGEAMQVTVCMEELSELIKELSKHQRGRANLQAIAEEIADVEIMLGQMRVLFSLDYDVDVQKTSKLMRLAQIIDNEKVRKGNV